MIINPRSMMKIVDEDTGKTLVVAFTNAEHIKYVKKGELSQKTVKDIFTEHKSREKCEKERGE